MDSVSLYTVAQVRALERAAIDTLGLAGDELMRRAGCAAFDLLRARWPEAGRILVLCGSGNNGGDGYALAAQARAAGMAVQVIALAAPPADGEAARALADWRSGGGAVLAADAPWPQADVYVDALFGIGLARPLEGVARAWVECLNAASRPVLALDVPSGLDADTGFAPDVAVRATTTITFVARKRGLYTGVAADHVGEVVFDALGVPAAIDASLSADARVLDTSMLRTWLPPRPRAAHKGLFGHVLAIGGDLGMGGAIRLAGEAALRVGAGRVSIATQAEHVTALNAARPELMAHGVAGIQELQALQQRASIIAVGPGLGQRAWGHALCRTAIAAGKPLVLDADALNLLAREPFALPAQAVLTPHPGEAARLLDCDTTQIERDRFRAVRELARRYAAVVVLKGAGTLVANPHGEVAICPWGNPGMASGGMGDVLTGVIAGLLAQGLDAWHAARLGVCLHAQAGDAAAAENGEAGLIASDLFAPLHRLRNGLAPT
jgi:NAD(P)H-hydrate epimerase